MPIAGHDTTPDARRNAEVGLLLLGAGAVMLFVSLFLLWYRPNLDAWTAFEAWDLVLAATALVTLFAVAGRMGYASPRPDSWLLGCVALAVVVVVAQLINPPPTAGLDDDPGSGLWLALAAVALMALGAVLSVARISVAVNMAGRHGVGPAGAAPPADPAAPGLGGQRFVRGAGPAEDPGYVADPAPGQRSPTAPTRAL